MPIFKQDREAMADDAERIALVEGGEAHAVKAHQPIERCQPQIAIARLHNVAHRVLRQSVVRRPMIEAVLGVSADQTTDDKYKQTHPHLPADEDATLH